MLQRRLPLKRPMRRSNRVSPLQLLLLLLLLLRLLLLPSLSLLLSLPARQALFSRRQLRRRLPRPLCLLLLPRRALALALARAPVRSTHSSRRRLRS